MSMYAVPQTHIPKWTVGERLRKAREDAGLSQEQLAQETSISKRQIVYYENDTKRPKRGEFLLWQMITRVPAEWLEAGIEPTTQNPDGGGTDTGLYQSHHIRKSQNSGSNVTELFPTLTTTGSEEAA